jgi:hypothetical protein
VSFDPKLLFAPLGKCRFFGEQDLKLYMEAAILGMRNYPASNKYDPTIVNNIYGYDSLWHKLPLMIGFNFPAFHLLDVLAVEIQWFGGTYPNNYYALFEGRNPLPYEPVPDYTHSDYAGRDDFKWSVYAKKTIVEGFWVMGQIARDHLRLQSVYLQQNDYEEALTIPKHWYWVLKFGYSY